jgi:hypothetical protein
VSTCEVISINTSRVSVCTKKGNICLSAEEVFEGTNT